MKRLKIATYAKRAFQTPSFTIKTPVYKLAKLLTPILSDITQRTFTVKDFKRCC